MVDTDVESILGEIREQVRASRAAQPASTETLGKASSGLAAGPSREHEDALALINSYLSATGRAWDRLPPVVRNRSGLPARIELWLKGNLRRATRWYAWEQINFNAAVHQTLRDLLPLVAAQQQEINTLKGLRTDLTRQIDELRTELDARHQEIEYLTSDLRERDERLAQEQRVCFKQLSLEATEAAVLEERARQKAEILLEELRSRVARLETPKS